MARKCGEALLNTPFLSFGLARPQFSSDASLRIDDAENRPALLGVADMIGRPLHLTWRNYMKSAEPMIQKAFLKRNPVTLDERDSFLQEQLLHHSAMIREIARRHDRSAFGFCIAFAAVAGSRCRIHWLGDCRAYRLRRSAADSPAWESLALTRDHNALDALIRTEGEHTLFRNEMQEISRNLSCFLGMDPEVVKTELLAQQVELELEPNDCLWMVTDGVYAPLLRVLLDRTRDRLDLPGLYLEGFLPEWLNDQPETDDFEIPWETLTRRLVRDVEIYTRRHASCRDDIAVTGYHPAPRPRPQTDPAGPPAG